MDLPEIVCDASLATHRSTRAPYALSEPLVRALKLILAHATHIESALGLGLLGRGSSASDEALTRAGHIESALLLHGLRGCAGAAGESLHGIASAEPLIRPLKLLRRRSGTSGEPLPESLALTLLLHLRLRVLVRGRCGGGSSAAGGSRLGSFTGGGELRESVGGGRHAGEYRATGGSGQGFCMPVCMLDVRLSKRWRRTNGGGFSHKHAIPPPRAGSPRRRVSFETYPARDTERSDDYRPVRITRWQCDAGAR